MFVIFQVYTYRTGTGTCILYFHVMELRVRARIANIGLTVPAHSKIEIEISGLQIVDKKKNFFIGQQ